MGDFQSTPTFQLFRRGLEPRVIKRFRGINAYKSITQLGPDWAQDCLNVLIPSWGGLSKFRLPVNISPAISGMNVGPNQFFDFQQAIGTRQVFANFGNSLYYYTWNGAGTALNAAVLVETAANDAPPWSFVEANNILFGVNGQRMMKWLGIGADIAHTWEKWGIDPPLLAPLFGSNGTAGFFVKINANGARVSRAGNVVTVDCQINVGLYLNVGDIITIAGASDPSFNGSFPVTTVVIIGQKFTFAQVGPNAGPIADGGYVTAPSLATPAGGFALGAAPVGAVRVNGITTLTLAAGATSQIFGIVGIQPIGPVSITVAGVTDGTFNGNFTLTGFSAGYPGGTFATFTFNQPGLPDSASGAGTVTFGATDSAFGRLWAYAYKNSITGHVSNMSPASPLLTFTNRIPLLYVPTPPTDPQVDTILWFATLDGGGDFFLVRSLPLTVGTGLLPGTNSSFDINGFADTVPDINLDKTTRGPLVNNPPPVGKYLAVGQSRIFIANLVGAASQIAYSGYERILLGRPEESYPPSNRLQLQIGAEAINGIGILTAGIVAFSATKKMYMLRGNAEDITLAAPVQFSAFLEELPWELGTLCHDSIQSTPYGLLFWATDKTVQIFDGYNQPQDVSGPVYPILRRATIGQEMNAKSAYFNWLDRDWYGLTFPIDGSFTNNFTIWWALHKDTMEIDIFLSNIPMDSMKVLSTPLAQRILAIGQGGLIKNLPVSQDTRSGIADLSIVPATGGQLAAYWRGGYSGNDTPQRAEMFRWIRLITDQDPKAFQTTIRLADDDNNPITAPYILGPIQMKSSKLAINRRAKRMSVEIDFPVQDVSANVLELQVNSVPSSDR